MSLPNPLRLFAALLVAGLALGLIACDNASGQSDETPEGDASASATGEASDEGGGQAAYPEGIVGSYGDWGTYGFDLQNTRHVPYDKITPENVSELGEAWSLDFQELNSSVPGGQQGSPLVVDGVMYIPTEFNYLFAVDAATGEVKWQFEPEEIGAFQNFGVSANRGVAMCDGKLFMLRIDMKLMSIDPDTGELIKMINIEDTVPDATTEFGYYETTAPVCYEDTVIIGSSGADNGARGFVMAYTTDLDPAWPSPYFTVPPHGQDWLSSGGFHGGGTVWVPVAVDPDTDTLYFSTANPSPDFFPELRPGPNPKTNSIIAVDVHTGEEKWWAQQTPNDSWDYDTGNPPILFQGTVDGEQRKLVAVGTKSGWWFAYDAETGDPVYEKVQLVNLLEHNELKPGEPVEIAPSTLGGVNYAPSSYDPDTNYVYYGTIESKSVLIQEQSAEAVNEGRQRGDLDTGAVNEFGDVPEGWHNYGSIVAVDVGTGEVAWRMGTSEPERGGVTTTATGLAFSGGGDGTLRAFDSATGAILWQFQTGDPIASPPVVYQVGDEEYVVVTIGGTSTSSLGGEVSRVMAFKLGGDTMQYGAPVLPGEGPEEGASEAGGGETQGPTPGQQPGAPGDLSSALSELPNGGYQLNLTAGEGPNNGFNFNTYFDGGATIRVPQGAQITARLGVSGGTPHSAIVSTEDALDQGGGFQPAFEGAESARSESGIQNQTDTFTFTADQPGSYVLLCGVPGHAAQGMWIHFEVGEEGSQAEFVPTPGEGQGAQSDGAQSEGGAPSNGGGEQGGGQ